MDKYIHSNRNITALGGFNFVSKAFKQKGLGAYLDEQLGQRGKRSLYSHSDIVLSMFGNCMSMGSFLSDIEVFKGKYRGQYFDKIPSADTIEYACRKLKTDTIKDVTAKGVVHFVNYCDSMNKTLVGLGIKTGILEPGKGCTVDYDNMILEHDKRDATGTYKKTRGYHAAFAFIDRMPVYAENHGGNTPAQYGQKHSVVRCLDNLTQQGIHISAFRADAASYQKELIPLIRARADHFYIRMNDHGNLRAECGKIEQWQKVLINNIGKEVASIEYKPFGQDDQYRVVVTRDLRQDRQIDMHSGTAYDYHGIMTNDRVMTDGQTIEFYNQRGDAENSNRYMLNDFNLHHLPFSDMDANTVFIYLMCMCATLFEWIKHVLVANKVKAIKLSMRVKAVCSKYITVATTYIAHARKKILKIFAPEGTYFPLKI